jgi:hypothetical protein
MNSESSGEERGDELTDMYARGYTSLDEARTTEEQSERIRNKGRTGGQDTASETGKAAMLAMFKWTNTCQRFQCQAAPRIGRPCMELGTRGEDWLYASSALTAQHTARPVTPSRSVGIQTVIT